MSGWRGWISHRFGLGPIADTVLHRRVARGRWYYGDGAALMLLLGVLVITGAIMTPTYTPSPDGAHESVRHITENVRLGWFIRALHYWSAGLIVVVLFAHVFRQVLIGGYKFPREGTWLTGVVLLFAVLAMSFTGYVLRWDERALYGLRVCLHMFYRVPWIGEHLVVLIQGGSEQGARSLTRLYSVHVIFIPLAILALVVFHMYLVLLHGVTAPAESRHAITTPEQQKLLYDREAQSEERGETFFPETIARSGGMAVVVFALALGLAVFAGPAPLMPEANLTGRSFPAEEWWFWWYSGLIALLPAWLAPPFFILFPIAIFLLLVLLPFIDRGPARGIRNRPIAVAVVIACVLALLYLTDLRRRSPWTAWPSDEPPALPEGVELPHRAEVGRELFARFGCNTCHPVAGRGPTFAVDLARLPQPYPRARMRAFILQPARGTPMPAYQGRIGEAELERILDFIHTAQAFPRR